MSHASIFCCSAVQYVISVSTEVNFPREMSTSTKKTQFNTERIRSKSKQLTVNFTLDLKRRRVKLNSEKTKQNILNERAVLEINETRGKV